MLIANSRAVGDALLLRIGYGDSDTTVLFPLFIRDKVVLAWRSVSSMYSPRAHCGGKEKIPQAERRSR